jgi:pyruvate,orthophosphate dikinase
MAAATAASKYVYDFSEGSRELRDLLGGKGANVAEMTRLLGPERVPAGFTITTEACVAYLSDGRVEPDGLNGEVDAALARLELSAGRRLGDSDDPLLVSVRSGARESMPGMLDTILNLGLNDESVGGLAARTGNPRFAWDSYRRFVQMFATVVHGVPGERFEHLIAALKPRPASDSPRRRASSSNRRSEPCSIRGSAIARSRTGESTTSPTPGAPRSTSSRWCSATRARRPGRAWRSAATS